MLTTLKNAFKIKEIRKKLLFTFLMLVVIRIGCQLPVPGVNRHFFSNWFAAQTGDTFSFFNAFTGGSFENMSLFALNITPYITSSIIIQLLTIAIPKLEEMHCSLQKLSSEPEEDKGPAAQKQIRSVFSSSLSPPYDSIKMIVSTTVIGAAMAANNPQNFPLLVGRSPTILPV